MKYRSGEIDIKETLFAKQTTLNPYIDINNASYYYDNTVGYQPLAAYNMYYQYYNPYNNYIRPMREMCTIVRKDEYNV